MSKKDLTKKQMVKQIWSKTGKDYRSDSKSKTHPSVLTYEEPHGTTLVQLKTLNKRELRALAKHNRIKFDYPKSRKKSKRSKRSFKQDQSRRSKQPYERGKGAKKKGNPRYKPVNRTGRDGIRRKVYIVRKRRK